jgi:hypothetical protein
MDAIAPETRELLKEDLQFTIDRVEEIKSGAAPNFRVLDQHYTDPLVSDSEVVSLSDERGEYFHYKELGHILLNILLQGHVPPKYHPRLKALRAPGYVLQLLEARV